MIALLVVLCALAFAAPLRLSEVLDAADQRVPQLAAAAAELEEAEGKLLSSRGAFDPKLAGKWTDYVESKSPRSYGVGYVELPTVLGPSFRVGYQLGRGDFPPYDLDWETVDLGEAQVSVAVPLLQGLGMGAERAALLVAERRVDEAVALRDDERLAVRRKAAEAWWKWVGAGARLELERSLLRLAEARQAALDRQVALGALAPLDALDHERVVQKRRADLLEARQELEVAALVLSLWYRDGSGVPIVPPPEALPPLPDPVPSELEGDVELALARRPDLAVLDALLAQAGVEVRAARNRMLPELDAVGRVDQGLGPEGKAEVVVGMELEAPLLLRKGRGGVAAAAATIDRLQAERRSVVDRVVVEVTAARTTRLTAVERAEALGIAAERAAEVARMEQRAFELGTSDLFRVLAREKTLAEASRDAVKGRVVWGLSDAAWRAAIGEVTAPEGL